MTDEKRLSELALRAARGERTAFSHFLEPTMVPACERCAQSAGARVAFFGGYPGAERVMAAFSGDGGEIEFPIECLRVHWNKKFEGAGHRDILGAVMGLGIEREATGDIVIGDGEAFLFAEREIARYICDSLTSAGRARVTVEIRSGEIEAPEPEGVRARITFSSPRLDSIVSAGYDLSRAEAQKLISQGLVKLNHAVCEKGDREVSEGDLISARGFGRMKVEEMLGATRKGRLAARIFKCGK